MADETRTKIMEEMKKNEARLNRMAEVVEAQLEKQVIRQSEFENKMELRFERVHNLISEKAKQFENQVIKQTKFENNMELRFEQIQKVTTEKGEQLEKQAIRQSEFENKMELRFEKILNLITEKAEQLEKQVIRQSEFENKLELQFEEIQNLITKKSEQVRDKLVIEEGERGSGSSNSTEILRYKREVQPAHCIFKIESFSALSENGLDKCESDDFEAGGYKWKIYVHPNGNKKRNVNKHISLYLAISDTSDLPKGWEVNVQFKLFVYDRLTDKYLTIQEDDGRKISRFNWMKTEWGFDELISLNLFNDTSNGYLFEDTCVFGAEIFVIKSDHDGDDGIRQCLKVEKESKCVSYPWKINHFSTRKEKRLESEVIKVGDMKWKLSVNFNRSVLNKSPSLFLEVANGTTLPQISKVFVEYKVRIGDQVTHTHIEVEDSVWVSESKKGSGSWSLMLLELKDKSKGLLVNDTLIVDIEVKNPVVLLKNFS